MHKRVVPTLGVASCIGGPSDSCAQGPQVLEKSPYASTLKTSQSIIELQWNPLLEVSRQAANSLDLLKKQSCVISQFSQQQLENHQSFLVLGGDHSIAIGTWSGIMNQLPADSTFALIWIDAHMDAHTLQSSPSGNLHGMPLSLILGEAEHELLECYPSKQYLDGRDLYLFGVRHYEADELVLLSKKNVNVFDTKRIEKDGGTVKVLRQLIETISRCYDYFAISLDLDAIDPTDAPGVETREKAGLRAENLNAVFSQLQFGENFVGLEIAEFDPGHDIDQITEKLVYQIINSVFST